MRQRFGSGASARDQAGAVVPVAQGTGTWDEAGDVVVAGGRPGRAGSGRA